MLLASTKDAILVVLAHDEVNDGMVGAMTIPIKMIQKIKRLK
jgi:hypothetical protein